MHIRWLHIKFSPATVDDALPMANNRYVRGGQFSAITISRAP